MKMILDELHPPFRAGMRRVERQEWWLWSRAVLMILLSSLGLISFLIPMLHGARVESGNL
jgi:hypothetical protein